MTELSIRQTLATLRAGAPEDTARISDGIAALILEYEFDESLPDGSSEAALPVQARLRRLIRNVDHLRAYEHATAGLRADLEDAGFRVDDVRQLGRESVGSDRALPVLLRWLPLLSDQGARSAVLLALHSKWARPDAIRPLVEELERLNLEGTPDPDHFSAQYGVISALCHLVDGAHLEVLVDIARNPANAGGRSLAIQALRKFRKRRSEVVEFMLEFLESDDTDVFLSAARALADWNIQSARDRLQYLLDTVDSRPTSPDTRYPEESKESERAELMSTIGKLAKQE